MTVVSGRVLDHAGRGVPGVIVSAVLVGARRFAPTPTTHTDPSGRWWLSLSTGLWRVRETGFGGREVNVDPEPGAIEERYEIDVALNEPLDELEVHENMTTSMQDIVRLAGRRRSVEPKPEPIFDPESEIRRLIARRQQEFSPRDDRDVDAPPSETRPLVESPIDVGDMTAFLRARRGE